jgi:2-(1,2-epoxy-1,2-dihydrophenyl)acetyl-CoA isomerase
MSDYEFILFEVDQGVATLTLNRPQALNALTFEMMAEVRQAMARVEADRDIRALIFTAAGRGFCSGQDLKNRPPEGADIVEMYCDTYLGVFNDIRHCRVPVIIAVNGTAAGGGFSLALSGDIIMAARSTKFIQVFSRIGLIPDLGSTWLLPRAIGRTRALKLMMTNEPILADQAMEWGMLADVVDDDQLLPQARELAAKLAKGPTLALLETRKMVDEGNDNDFAAQFRRELEVNSVMRDTFDGKEGVNAFLEKRATSFRGE